VTLVALNDAVGPSGEIEVETFTFPPKPARLVKVTVEFADEPGASAKPLGFAKMAKSGGAGFKTLRVATTEWESRPS
jgi:hypothetical protein